MQPPPVRKPNRPVEGSATSTEPTIDIERGWWFNSDGTTLSRHEALHSAILKRMVETFFFVGCYCQLPIEICLRNFFPFLLKNHAVLNYGYLQRVAFLITILFSLFWLKEMGLEKCWMCSRIFKDPFCSAILIQFSACLNRWVHWTPGWIHTPQTSLSNSWK